MNLKNLIKVTNPRKKVSRSQKKLIISRSTAQRTQIIVKIPSHLINLIKKIQKNLQKSFKNPPKAVKNQSIPKKNQTKVIKMTPNP